MRRPPPRFGKPNSVRMRFDRWYSSGVWPRVAKAWWDEALAKATDEAEELQLDATRVKAHPIASTGRRLPHETGRRSVRPPSQHGAVPDQSIEESQRGNRLSGRRLWNKYHEALRWLAHELRCKCPERELGSWTMARRILRSGGRLEPLASWIAIDRVTRLACKP